MQYYFVSQKEGKFQLTKEDYHHVKNVMRLKENDHLVCVYEQKKYLCAIHYIKDSYWFETLNEMEPTKELPLQIELYQALIKNDKMDWVIQKVTEIGVTKIIPMMCKRCIVKIEENKQETKLIRYQKIIKEACEQSHRSVMPAISEFIDLKDIQLEKNTLGLVAYEQEMQMKDWTSLIQPQVHQKIAILIGPEGGFEKEEIELLKNKGFHCISLGSRILRSETAAIYACSVLAHHLEYQKEE